jgi:NTE family protein
MSRAGFSLVLGGGGFPGHAYLGGVLSALADVAQIDARDSRLTVGTSAGALQAALVAAGTPPDRHRDLALQLSRGGQERPFVRSWDGLPDLGRRLLVSSVDVGTLASRRLAYRSRPMPVTGGGVIKTREPQRYFGLLPQGWPERDLALVAYDITRRRRRLLTRATCAGLDLRQSVEASMTLPGLMTPVHAGGERLVDGGAASATNLDVAVRGSARLVIAIAPMAFDPRRPPRASFRAAYSHANAILARQSGRLRAAGQQLILIRPGARELDVMGINFLRAKDPAAIAQMAYDQAARELNTDRSRRLLAEIAQEEP